MGPGVCEGVVCKFHWERLLLLLGHSEELCSTLSDVTRLKTDMLESQGISACVEFVFVMLLHKLSRPCLFCCGWFWPEGFVEMGFCVKPASKGQ